MTTPIRIGILLGSARANGNNEGIAQWVLNHLAEIPNATPSLIPLTQDPLPLGPLYDDIVPQSLVPIPNPDGTGVFYPYPSERDRQFSSIIQQLDALVVVTPQYNWSLPGELKNTFDHLFHEWAGMPMAVVTYGGRGGNKCAEAMRAVIGGIRAEEVSVGKVMVVVPRESHIVGQERIRPDDEILRPYDDTLREELDKLVVAARSRKEKRANA